MDYFLGAFAKLHKPTIGFVMSAHHPVSPLAWIKSAFSVRIYVKFGI
jgi:hypothetical protein